MSVADDVKRLEQENARMRAALQHAIEMLQNALGLIDDGTPIPTPPVEVESSRTDGGGKGEYRVDTSEFVRRQDG